MSQTQDDSLPILLAFLGIPSGYEFLIIVFIALLLFGKRIPSVMHSLGKSLVEFKKGVKGIEDDLEKEEGHSTNAESSEKE